MPYSKRALLLMMLLTFAAQACALPAVIPPDAGAISTAAAQTVIAGLTQAASSSTLQTPMPSASPEPPTHMPTQTLTATLTFTSTPTIPRISVSVATNCRSGPGKVYDYEGALLVGETAEVFGRDPSGGYWYIRNPDSGSKFCWAWGKYATFTGNTSILPIYTPAPTPTPTLTPTPSPNFAASYTSLDACAGWWVEIRLKNTGSISFKSMGITIKDTVTGVLLANYTDGFTNINGCLSSTTKDTLSPGKTYVISAPAFTYEPSGHKLRATITLCSKPGQNGSCVTKTINFRP